MNYYESTLNKIEEYIENKEYEKAYAIISNELEMVYIPLDFEKKLHEYLSKIEINKHQSTNLSDEEISDYLFSKEMFQLTAVNYLDKRNLREYIELIQEYFDSDCFKNAAVLLIDSLIKQEINYEFKYLNISFNPSLITPINNNINYQNIVNKLSDYYLKDPSKLRLAIDLLNKEALMLLPLSINSNNSDVLYKKIIEYIDNAFEC